MSDLEPRDKIKKELNELRSFLKKNRTNLVPVKILENIGDNSFLIKFPQFNEFDLNVTLQIAADLNLKNARTIINSGKSHNHEQIDQLRLDLDNCIHTNLNKPNFLIDFFTMIEVYINTNFNSFQTNDFPSKSNKKNPKSKNEKRLEEEEECCKKPSMKTALDVVNRIIWDTRINRDWITVGYLDRFVGLKECTFNTFEWGDIVEADLNALAIPKHRISYFKYKGEKIWDKSSRLDNFFGSTGSNQTIYEIIDQMENVDFKPEILNTGEEIVNKVGRVNKAKNESPNYFVSIQITNQKLLNNLKLLTDDLLTSNYSVNEFMIPAASYHVTLCTLRVDGEEELSNAKQALKSMRIKESVEMDFRGVADFYNKVFHVKCECKTNRLENLKKLIVEKFEEFGVNLSGNYYEFVPHLTIFKIAGGNRQQVCLLIDNETWMKYEDFYFGTQNVNEVELCQMVNIQTCLTYPVDFTLKLEN